MQKVISETLAADPLAQLAKSDSFVGWIYSIDYESALILTNDLWKADVGGVPQNCFLTAAPFLAESFSSTPPDDQIVLLLRVIGTTRLPATDDLIATRIDHFQRQPDRVARSMDDLTQNQLQHHGLECHVLGTFYVDRRGELRLGSDIESFSAAGTFNVFRPQGEALGMIVNFIDPDSRRRALKDLESLQPANDTRQGSLPIAQASSAGMAFRLGTVRYTSTDRMHRGAGRTLVPVNLQAADFLARRTAVFGMTRSGKSNSIKHLVSAVKQVADQHLVPIGQLLFDLRGEYAKANVQDQTSGGEASSLADAFPPGEVIRYRARPGTGYSVLLNNFYVQLAEGHSIIQEVVREDANAGAIDVQTFLNMSLEEPDAKDYGLHSRWKVKVAAYQAMLHKAGFPAPANRTVSFSANKSVRDAVAPYYKRDKGEDPPDPSRGLDLETAQVWFECARRADRAAFGNAGGQGGRGQGGLLRSDSGGEWLDAETSAILNMLAQRNTNDSFIRGLRVLDSAREYHSPQRRQPVEKEIYEYLQKGKIVIVDLSVGPAFIRDKITGRLAHHIFARSQEVFLDGKTPPTLVVYIEEAHNLIHKRAELTEVWPTIAKEGAKFRISLVYATQEPSSIHPNILSNTENWIVTHLNNDDELRHLAKFYDFGDFVRSLKSATDVGFARVRTLSAKFVVPVHIDVFDPQEIRNRSTAGQPNGSQGGDSEGSRVQE